MYEIHTDQMSMLIPKPLAHSVVKDFGRLRNILNSAFLGDKDKALIKECIGQSMYASVLDEKEFK